MKLTSPTSNKRAPIHRLRCKPIASSVGCVVNDCAGDHSQPAIGNKKTLRRGRVFRNRKSEQPLGTWLKFDKRLDGQERLSGSVLALMVTFLVC